MRWLAQGLKRALFCIASIALSGGFVHEAAAQAYLETGQTGAQTQIDVNHTTTMYIGAPASFLFGGANYVMKRGSSSTANVDFTVYPNASCTGTPLVTVTNISTAFDSSYAPVLFQIPGNLTLTPGIYCTKLTSSAVDQQNEAFFIKGFEACVVLPESEANGAVCSTTIPTLAPNLSVTKSAPLPGLAVGASSTYTLTVTNSGNLTATTAQVKDQLPTGLTFVSAAGSGWTCANASGLVTCNYTGSIAASGGTSTIDVAVVPNAGTAGQSLINHASIDPTGGPNPPTPGPACATPGSCSSATAIVSAPNLSLVKSAPTPGLALGVQSTYTLTVTNSGTAAATTARALDQLPTGLTFVSATGSGWTCANASGLVTCNYAGSIAASGGTSTIDVAVVPNAGTAGQSLINHASIDPTGGPNPPTPGPACATPGSCSSATAIVSAPNLTIAKAAPTPALELGARSSYVLTVTNKGSVGATTAQIKDQLPGELSFISAAGNGWSCNSTGLLVTCDFTGSIPTGGTSTVSVVVSTTSGAPGRTVTNYASVDPTGGSRAQSPSPSCMPASSCASVSSAIGDTKRRTETLVHNFLAKRGERIVSNGLDLNRLYSRTASTDCDDELPVSPGPRVSSFGSQNGPLPQGFAGTTSQTQDNDNAAPAEIRRMDFGRGLASRLQGPGRGDDRDAAAPRASGIALTGSGTGDEGRLNLSASLSELRKAGASSRTGQGDRCADRKRAEKFDIWVEGSYEYFNHAGSQGSFGLWKFGVDYTIKPGLLVGVMMQLDHTQDKSETMGYLVKGSGWMAGPYAAMRLGPNILLDGRYLAGLSRNEVSPYLTYNDTFTTERWLAAARLSGRWTWKDFTFTPSIEYVHFSDKSASYTDSTGIQIDSQKVTIDRLIFGPEIRYTTELSDKSSLGLHAGVKGLWDINKVGLRDLDNPAEFDKHSNLHIRFDIGASLQMSAGPSLELNLGYEGLGQDSYSSKSITGRLRIPLQ
ncbi:MAG: DUF11 domain-containing protein [Hyphomicrobiaceae bacterium]|nr:DUF11 domain-containing protein [Hyphomicrobiaceae bacterium]